MTRRLLAALLAALLALPLLAACGGEESVPIDRSAPQQLPVGELVAVDLPPPFGEGDQLRASFEDGEVTFAATCNTMYGTVSLDGDVLVVDSVGGTEMGCPGAGVEQDEWLVDLFTSRPTLDARDVGFSLEGELADLVLLPPEAAPGDDDLPLEGTRWELTGIEEREGDSVGFLAVPPEVDAWMEIADGQVSFRTGCNGGGGPAEVVGDQIVLGEIAIQLVGCRGGEAEVENRSVRVLMADSAGWSVDGEQLRLTRGDTTLLYTSG